VEQVFGLCSFLKIYLKHTCKFIVTESIVGQVQTREPIMGTVRTLFTHTDIVGPHVLVIYHVSEFVCSVLEGTLVASHKGLKTITRLMPNELIGVYEVMSEVSLDIGAPDVPLDIFWQRAHIDHTSYPVSRTVLIDPRTSFWFRSLFKN
jgi:hypothetical protein